MKAMILQANPKCAAVKQNLAKVVAALKLASEKKIDLLITPELFLLGYTPKDLLAYPKLHKLEQDALGALKILSKELGVALLIGHSEKAPSARSLYYNSASLFHEGNCLKTIRKRRIPSYDIFDEHRFFIPWPEAEQTPISFKGKNLGVFICEDAWTQTAAFGVHDLHSYDEESSPWEDLRASDILINLSASPYHLKKRLRRESLFLEKAKELGKPLIYVNCVGAQDDLLFDGASFACNALGEMTAQAKVFEEENLLIDLDRSLLQRIPYEHWAELYKGLTLGIRDYCEKNYLKSALLGVSGGADSALAAALTTAALGASNVMGLSLPSPLTSQNSKTYAQKLTNSLGMRLEEISIAAPVALLQQTLSIEKGSITYENLQARCRGIYLMSRANENNSLLLATSNKSESAMGYTTLYGDMCGTLAPIADLYKTEVYGLSYYIKNTLGIDIPQEILRRPPSAELAENQKDTDSLPVYSVLDTFLEELLENQALQTQAPEWSNFSKFYGLEQIPQKVMKMEYKRYQAAPILKVHHRSFGSGWRFPLSKGLETFMS